MKMPENQIVGESQGELSESDFGISEGDQAHILTILRDKLYSDKVAAVLREYGTNALDAHVDIGTPKRKIEVTLPTRLSPVLKIRDYGTGLSETGIREIFTQYGRSTKRDSDNAIGQLGLGCKSGFAYTQQFTVTCWHNGTKSIYNAYIDPSNIGKMAKLHEEPCPRIQHGIEVAVPVQLQDINKFHSTARKVYRYFEPTPQCNIQLEKPEYSIVRGWWRIKKEWDDGPVAVMGSIGYPLRADRLNGVPHDLLKILETPIEIRFNIGELTISANREDLEYSKHSIEAIHHRLKAVMKDLREEISKEFQNCQTIWEAKTKFDNLISVQAGPTGRYRSRNIFAETAQRHAIWNGHKLNNRKIPDRPNSVAAPAQHCIEEIKAMSGYSKAWNKYTVNLQANPGDVLAVNHGVHAYFSRTKKLRSTITLTSQNANNYRASPGVIVLNIKKDATREEAKAAVISYCEYAQITGIPVKWLDEVDYISTGVQSSGSTVNKKKTAKKAFAMKNDLARYSIKSDHWETAEAELKDGEGIYVEIFRFDPVGSSCSNLVTQQKTLVALGLPQDQLPKIYGFKKAYAAKLGTKWTKWEDWFKAKQKELLESNPLFKKLGEYQIANNFRWNNGSNIRKVPVPELSADHEVNKFIALWAKLYREYVQAQTPEKAKLQNLASAINHIPVPCELNLDETYKDLCAKYPLLNYTRFWVWNKQEPLSDQEHITKYIKMIDEQGETNE